MLCQPFQNAVGFADICQTFFVRIVGFAEQDVNAGIVHILSVRALADTRSRDTVCFSIPVGQFATDTPFRGAIHQEQCYFLTVCHLERIILQRYGYLLKCGCGTIEKESFETVVRILREGSAVN